jgi:hypothetical protein
VLFVGQLGEEEVPLGAKGLGELTAVSVAPAIANAVYPQRASESGNFSITIEKLSIDG